MEPTVFVLIINDLRLLSLILSISMRVRLCIKARSKTAVVDDTDARFLQSLDFAFLYTTCFKFVFDAGLVDILLTGKLLFLFFSFNFFTI